MVRYNFRARAAGRSSLVPGCPIVKRILIGVSKYLLVVLLLAFLLTGDTLRLNPAQKVALPHHYSLVSWEVSNFLSKWTHRLAGFFPWTSGPDLEGRELVEEYFRLGDEVRRLRGEINRAAASGPDGETTLAQREAELARVMNVRDHLRGDVEEVIESTISAVLSELDIASWGDLDYPPVDIRLDQPPKVLVTSPRDRIMRSYEALVATDVTVEEREAMEDALLESEDLSALVADIGGVATYPAIVGNTGSLRWTLGTAAHEWMHHYLVAHLRPLGLKVYTNPEMQTINETMVDMAGREIGDLAFQMLGGVIEPPPHDDDREGSSHAGIEDEDAFDFDKEMRETRRRVDDLLAAGAVEDAEAYMEERRRFFARNGAYIRKLNQAYFAINGTYAEQPESSSPIGDQMREIRALIPDPKAFISAVSRVSSHESFLKLLERLRVQAADGGS